MKNFIFVAGSAHLDIISQITDYPEVIDKIGNIKYEFGGTAYNHAINLSKLKEKVTFMSAFNNSTISQLIINELLNNNIKIHLKIIKKLKDSGYSAQLLNGLLISAVSSMPVADVTFSKSFIKKGMKGAKAVIIDCNLSIDSINNILNVANNLKIPSFIACVSEAKCRKILDLSFHFDYALLNIVEMNMLEKITQEKNWKKIAQKLKTNLIVTQDKRAVFIYSKKGEKTKFKVTPQKIKGNSLGAGDLFGASFISNILKGKSISNSINKAIENSYKILNYDNANLGSKKALEDSINLIKTKAEKDKLTNVFNRHGIETFISMNNLDKTESYIALCDIDNFKQFNDLYGHDIGDLVLKNIAKIIKTCIRSQDAVGRWGGEEFICFINTNNKKVAISIAERIRTQIENLKLKDIKQQTTVSIGLIKTNPNKLTSSNIKIADQLLYKAKKEGKNKVCYK